MYLILEFANKFKQAERKPIGLPHSDTPHLNLDAAAHCFSSSENTLTRASSEEIMRYDKDSGPFCSLPTQPLRNSSSVGNQLIGNPGNGAACVMCNKGKMKCAKTIDGCMNCTKSGIECVARPAGLKRKAEGRKEGKSRKRNQNPAAVAILPTENSHLSDPLNHKDDDGPNTGTYTPSSAIPLYLEQGAFISRTRPEPHCGTQSSCVLSEREREIFRFLCGHVSWLHERLKSAKPLTLEENQRLRSVKRTIENTNPREGYQLTDDLIKAEKDIARYRAVTEGLAGKRPLMEITHFPETLGEDIVDREWKAIRKDLQQALGVEYSGWLPQPEDLAYFSAIVDRCLAGSDSEYHLVEWFRVNMAQLENRIILQTLLTAILCRRVFADHKLMFEGKHGEICSKIYVLLHANGQ
jgi:hypothetical protein